MRYLCASATILNRKCNLRLTDESLIRIRTTLDEAQEGKPFALYFELDAEVRPTCQGLVFVPEDDAFYAPHPVTVLYDFEDFESARAFALEKARLAENVRQSIEAKKELTSFVKDVREKREKLWDDFHKQAKAQKFVSSESVQAKKQSPRI